MAESKNLAGLSFGKWHVLDSSRSLNHRRQWLCRCECGNEKYVDAYNLMSGKSTSCGCFSIEKKKESAKDLTGQVFGKLTVIRRAVNKNGRVCWECLCECGNTKIVSSHQLCTGKTRSCGCLRKVKTIENHGIRDISGSKIGFLEVLYPTEKRSKKRSVYWHCRCTRCGKEVDLTEDQLMHGLYKSCGCYRKEVQENIGKTLHFVDGTCVEWLEKRKHRSDNTSGYRGVFKESETRWKASIGFKRKRYYLGSYDTFEKAVQVRKKAENMLHVAFVDEYKQWKIKADSDPEWAADNPFSFHDEKRI